MYIIWEECDYLGIRIKSKLLKKLDFDVSQDLYIFPDTLNWTFVSTHENGWFGPFYSDKKLKKPITSGSTQTRNKRGLVSS